ncbi:MAG: hypothetical protein HYW77_00050 [Parcubacteria group bacterium]|nr:hypothetical protein [Parcubacteria group bacterium]
MVQVYRKPRETIPSLIRRFSRAVQTSGVLDQAKAKRSSRRKPSERVIKQRAIMAFHLRKLRIHLEKVGQYSEEKFEIEKKKLKQKLGL